MRTLPRLSPLIALAALGLGASLAGAQPAPSDRSPPKCFSSNDWRGWKASKDSKTLYIGVGVGDVYRLDLAYACPDLHNIDARVINRVTGGDPNVCTPLDLDLTVITPPGESSPCTVKAITPLTRDQAAALPKELKP